jgi:hypothetical protein
LAIPVQPASINTLQFSKSQEFKLAPPVDAKGLKYDWRVNGAKVRGDSRYVFANDDPGLVGKNVKVEVNVADDSNRTFAKRWAFTVQAPPAPRVAGSPASPVKAKIGAPVDLRLTPSNAAAGQTLSYVFSVDGGREQKSARPEFRFTPANEEHAVVARAVDNFGQRSAPVTWSVRSAAVAPPAPPEPVVDGAAAVRAWLEDYRQAFIRKDVDALRAMMKLSGDKAEALRKQLASQNDLAVAFSNVEVESLGNGRYRATYNRRDSFTSAQTGRAVAPPAVPMRQEFRSLGGVVQLEK